MDFPVVMYGCESWTVKKSEHHRFDAFKLWCLGGLLRVPWTVRRSTQSIVKEISPEYSLEGLMMKLQYSGHLMRRAASLEKTLMLGKIEGQRDGADRGSNGEVASPTQRMWTPAKSRREWRQRRLRAAVRGGTELGVASRLRDSSVSHAAVPAGVQMSAQAQFRSF